MMVGSLGFVTRIDHCRSFASNIEYCFAKALHSLKTHTHTNTLPNTKLHRITTQTHTHKLLSILQKYQS